MYPIRQATTVLTTLALVACDGGSLFGPSEAGDGPQGPPTPSVRYEYEWAGYVTSSVDGAPIEGVSVEPHHSAPNIRAPGAVQQRTYSDSRGFYRLSKTGRHPEHYLLARGIVWQGQSAKCTWVKGVPTLDGVSGKYGCYIDFVLDPKQPAHPAPSVNWR